MVFFRSIESCTSIPITLDDVGKISQCVKFFLYQHLIFTYTLVPYLHLVVLNRMLLIYTLINVNVLHYLVMLATLPWRRIMSLLYFPRKLASFLLELETFCKYIPWKGDIAMDCFVS